MILLNRSYKGYAAGAIAQFATQEEAALVTNGWGTLSAGPVTPGPFTTTNAHGRAGIAAAGTSVTVTSPFFTTESKFVAYLSQAAADTTAFRVDRIVPANGSVTFFLNAASTGAVSIDWAHLLVSGELQPN